MVNIRVQNAVLGCNLKNYKMISVRFQGKPFNIIVIQVYAPTGNAEEAQDECFYEDLQDLEITAIKRCPFHYRGLECKSRESSDTWSNRPIWPLLILLCSSVALAPQLSPGDDGAQSLSPSS